MSNQAPIIAAQTGAATETVEVRDKRALLTCDALGGGETVSVKVKAGSAYVDLYQDGTQQQLTTTNTAMYLPAPGDYEIAKSSTSGSVAVYTLPG